MAWLLSVVLQTDSRLSLVACRLSASVCPVCPARPTVWLAMSASEAACASACLSNYIVAMLHVKFFLSFFSYARGNLAITERWRQGFEFGFGILTTAVSCQIYFNFLFAVECAKFSIPRQTGAATGEAEEAGLLLSIGRRLAVCQKLSKQHEQHDRPEPPNQAS